MQIGNTFIVNYLSYFVSKDSNLGTIIREILTNSPKGLSIQKLTERTGVSRNTVSKTLESLRVQGLVDLRMHGTSKVYFSSNRVSYLAVQSLCPLYLIFNRNLEIIDFSSDCKDLFNLPVAGIKTPEILRTHLPEIDELITVLKKAVRGVPSEGESSFISRSMTQVINWKMVPVFLADSSSGAVIILSTPQDLSSQKILNYSKQVQDTIEQESREWKVTLSPHLLITSANQEFVRMYGLAERFLIGKEFKIRSSDPVFNKKIISVIQSLSRKSPVEQVTSHILYKDGSVKVCSIRLCAVFKSDNSVESYICLGCDISDLIDSIDELQQEFDRINNALKSGKDELQKSNAMLLDEISRTEVLERELSIIKAAIENTKEIIGIFDKRGYLLYGNNNFYNLFSSGRYLNNLSIDDFDGCYSGISLINTWHQVWNEGSLILDFEHSTDDGSTEWKELIMEVIPDIQFTICVCSVRSITNRKKQEFELERIRDIIKETPDVIITLNMEGNILYINKAGKEYLEIPDNYNFLKNNCRQFVHNNSYNLVMEGIRSAFVNKIWRGEVEFISLSMIILPVSMIVISHQDPMTGNQIISIVARDISERKKNDASIAYLFKFYLSFINMFPNPVWKSGPDGGCEYFNEAWLNFTGRSLEEERGDGWLKGVHPDDREYCLSHYLSSFVVKKPFSMEYRLLHNDGTYHRIIDYGSPIYDPDDVFLGYIGSCFDILDSSIRKAASLDVLPKIEFMKNYSSDLIWESNRSGYCSFNAAVFHQLGYYEDDLIGVSPEKIIDPESYKQNSVNYRKARKNPGKAYSMRTTYLSNKGEKRTFSSYIISYQDIHGEFGGFIGIERYEPRNGIETVYCAKKIPSMDFIKLIHNNLQGRLCELYALAESQNPGKFMNNESSEYFSNILVQMNRIIIVHNRLLDEIEKSPEWITLNSVIESSFILSQADHLPVSYPHNDIEIFSDSKIYIALFFILNDIHSNNPKSPIEISIEIVNNMLHVSLTTRKSTNTKQSGRSENLDFLNIIFYNLSKSGYTNNVSFLDGEKYGYLLEFRSEFFRIKHEMIPCSVIQFGTKK